MSHPDLPRSIETSPIEDLEALFVKLDGPAIFDEISAPEHDADEGEQRAYREEIEAALYELLN